MYLLDTWDHPRATGCGTYKESALNLGWKSLFTSTCHANLGDDDDLSIYQRLVVSARYICIYGVRSDITWREILVRLSSPLVAYR